MASPGSALRAPLLWLLLPFMGGIAVANLFSTPAGALPWLAGLAAGLAVLAIRLGARHRPGWIAALLPAAALGGFVWLHRQTPEPPAWTATPREVTILVRVDQVFSTGGRSWHGLGRIEGTSGAEEGLTGQRVYFSASRRSAVVPLPSGSYLLRGVLQSVAAGKNEEGFARYLDALGIRLTLTRAQFRREEQPPGPLAVWAEAARTRLDASLARGLDRHPEELAMYRGMLLGEKAELTPEQSGAFQRSGTFHIFVIAGLHIGVITTAIASVLLLLRLPRRGRLLLTLGLVAAYVAVTGAGLPARRALLMIALYTFAKVARLPANGLAILSATALAVLLLDPHQLANPGFQMSFAVVLGLVTLGATLIRRGREGWQPWASLPPASWRRWQRWSLWLGRKVLTGLVVSFVSLLGSAAPIIATFGFFSPGALLANLAVVPLAMLTICAGFASLVSGLLHCGAGCVLFNHAAVLLLKVMEALVGLGVRLPGMFWPAHFYRPWLAPLTLAAVVTALLAGAAAGWSRRWRAVWWPPAVLGLALILVVKFG